MQDGKTAEALFAGWEESLIWSCLRGTMGYLYADAQEEPHSAMAILGDFVFFAGRRVILWQITVKHLFHKKACQRIPP